MIQVHPPDVVADFTNREFNLLEKDKVAVAGGAGPMRAEVVLIKATKADHAGNLICKRATCNFNPVMAMAADRVIAEVDEIVDTGLIDPDDVTIPGIFVDYVCLSARGINRGR